LTVYGWFDLKITRAVFTGLASKPVITVRFGLKTSYDGFLWFGLKTSDDGFLQFGLKTRGDGFSRFGIKTDGRFLVEPQNQGGGFPGLGLKTGSSGLVI
jgi:hypothetical protein